MAAGMGVFGSVQNACFERICCNDDSIGLGLVLNAFVTALKEFAYAHAP